MESGTAWLNKYRFDPFFRTEVNVVLLQVAFALVILGLVGTAFTLLYRDIASAIAEGIRAGLVSESPAALGPAIVAEIEAIRTETLVGIVAVVAATTTFFGYVIARVTLAPARNALASQKQFIGNIAHELRTPLSIVKTNTEVALLEGSLSAELKQTLANNIDELDRVSEIINNLLSLSALLRPERLEFVSVDLSELAERVVEKFAQLARRGEHNIIMRKSPHAHVWANPAALEQIVGNILKNAIAYTPRGGDISMTIAPAMNNFIEISIQDTGIGIARKDLFRIFEPFYRAEQSRNRAQGGSGLGLAIVSELLKMLGGKIMIRSAVGRGTTVTVLLPAARRHAFVGGQELHEGLNEVAVDFSGSRKSP